MSVNPVKEFLRSKNVKADDFALMANVDVMVIYQVLRGLRSSVPAKILNTIEKVGGDPHEMQSKYKAWRLQKGKELLSKIK